jgi:hypothetical protein
VSVPSTFDTFAVLPVTESIYYVNMVTNRDIDVQSIYYNGTALPEIADLQSDNDYKYIEIDAENRYTRIVRRLLLHCRKRTIELTNKIINYYALLLATI